MRLRLFGWLVTTELEPSWANIFDDSLEKSAFVYLRVMPLGDRQDLDWLSKISCAILFVQALGIFSSFQDLHKALSCHNKRL